VSASRQFAEGTTLDRYLMETLREYPGATGAFVDLVQSVALAGKMISARVNRAGLAGMLGGTGEVNIQGEFVQKLDVYANEVFIRALEHRGHACLIVSEESEGAVHVDPKWGPGRYVVTTDPLDGSSNIDVNATIGTIFGVFRRKSAEGRRGRSRRRPAAGHRAARGRLHRLRLGHVDRPRAPRPVCTGSRSTPPSASSSCRTRTSSIPARCKIYSVQRGLRRQVAAGRRTRSCSR
jgi:hypothetical protein